MAQRYVADRFDVSRVARELAAIVRLQEMGQLATHRNALTDLQAELPSPLSTSHENTNDE